ncbi:MAG: LysM peptidoglycan-binding domain-containing protein [Clostridiales bacterium]|nr:LysM peptidoglycan-binding domain-containing protein [Clostridiales bacterium]
MESTKTNRESKEATNKVKNHEFKMPKNLRQIGNISNLSKLIYVEDYVMSYIKQLSSKAQSESKIAILLGKDVFFNGIKNIFIKGAIEMPNIDINENSVFTDDSWSEVYVNIKEYFSDVEIVGWAIIGIGIVLDSNSKIKNLHKENFEGPDTVLLKYDCLEKEENFYLVEDEGFTKQKGYYIYYEKNVEMQNYMIDYNNKHKEKTREDYEDIATKKIRTIIDEKNNKKIEKGTARFSYAVGSLLAVVVLMVATTMLRNYHQIKNLETALYSLTENLRLAEAAQDDKKDIEDNVDLAENSTTESTSETLEEENDNIDKEQEGSDSESVDVETVPGNVSQTEEASSEPQDDEPQQLETQEETQAETKEVVSTINEVKYYIVRPGDSLVTICSELYNDTSQERINKILELNGIENQDKIYAGQKLIVP